MLETRVLEQCEPIELAMGLLSAPSRPEEALSEPNWADATLDWALYEPHWSPGASSATMASGPALSGALYFLVEPGEVEEALPSRSIMDSQGRLKHSERKRRQRARNALALRLSCRR